MNKSVGIIMGSASDLPVMEGAQKVLAELGVPCEMTVVSAHRTPDRMVDYARGAADRGVGVIVAGAGGAAHLPGMTASLTPLPVIGVPIKSRNSIDGWDSVLSILQMPSGVQWPRWRWMEARTPAFWRRRSWARPTTRCGNAWLISKRG